MLVGAPHTSNWDFVMMLLVMWRGDVTPRVLIKKELFRGPLAWLLPKGEYWKSGFRRLARAAKPPTALAFIDGPSRTAGFGRSITATSDVVADMDQLPAFYADKRGLHPELRTEPRLREELTAGGDDLAPTRPRRPVTSPAGARRAHW